MAVSSERQGPMETETDCSGCRRDVGLQRLPCTLIASAFLTLLSCGFRELNKCTPDTAESRSTMQDCVACRRGYHLGLTCSVLTSLHLSLLESSSLPVYGVGRTMPTLVSHQSTSKGVSKPPGVWQDGSASCYQQPLLYCHATHETISNA